jgi:hypothetical protein
MAFAAFVESTAGRGNSSDQPQENLYDQQLGALAKWVGSKRVGVDSALAEAER